MCGRSRRASRKRSYLEPQVPTLVPTDEDQPGFRPLTRQAVEAVGVSVGADGDGRVRLHRQEDGRDKKHK